MSKKTKRINLLGGFEGAAGVRNAYLTALNDLPPVVANGQVSRAAILQRLCLLWRVKDPTKVKETDALTPKYIKQGGPGYMSAYYAVLNECPEFQPDGLNLQTNDTAFVTTVGQLINAISNWYSTNKMSKTRKRNSVLAS